MRPGDLIALKDGILGLSEPQNLAIFLERRKRKKDFFLVIHTIKGRHEIKPQQVAGRRFHANVDPGMDEETMTERLRVLFKEAQEGGLQEERQGTEGELDERRVWELVVNRVDGPTSLEDLASLYHGASHSKGDVRRMQEMLDRCKRPGVGFFERRERGRWAPIPVADHKAFHAKMEVVNRVRRKLVRIVMVDDDSGEPWESFEGVPIEEAQLTDEERETLEHMFDAMARFVLEDRWPDDATPPGTTRHTLMGQSYHRAVEWLARDWTGAKSTSLSSAIVEFLVDTKHTSVQDAIRLIARRSVKQTPGFAWETPPDIESYADAYEEPEVAATKDPDLYAVREDLRSLPTYTIDPPDAKDFDDAISFEEHADGSATLWVHIADVSHYVEKDSRLDRHARERATSVYLPTGVLPMLPHRLADNLCSLREDVDRLAVGVRLDVSPEGDVTAALPYEAIIQVDQNLHYGQVDEMVAQGVQPFAALEALARRMRDRRKGLAIETGELRIQFAEQEAADIARREGLVEEDDALQGVPDDRPDQGAGMEEIGDGDAAPDVGDVGLAIQIKRSSPATRMIESFMVAANEAVSRYVDERGLAVPFRCHPLPDRSRVERFEGQAKTLGFEFEFDLPDINPVEETDPSPTDDADDEEDADDGGGSILDQLRSGKLQLGGFAASETIGSRPADEARGTAEPAERAEAGAAPRPSIRGLAQLDPAKQEAWLAPFRHALATIDAIEDQRLRDLLFIKALGMMSRALYTPHNLGHFGLGSTSYAHFTSPIRRYPDLALHRQLRWLLRKDKGLETEASQPHPTEHLEALCDHCSTQGEAAERLERRIKNSCITFESRRDSWSDRLTGTVMGITNAALFLELTGNLEARLPLRDLPGGPYDVDEHESMLFRTTLPGGGARASEDPEDEGRLPLDWREMTDPATGEVREVRVRLGDRIPVRITKRDFVDGRVEVRLAGGL